MEPYREAAPAPKPLVQVVYAGGTISSLATAAGYREGGHVVDLLGRLEQHRPGAGERLLLGKATVAYTGLSENIDEAAWDRIAQQTGTALEHHAWGVVITHGTDSMEQTARRLQARFGDSLRDLGSRVVLTGANEDIAVADTDAWDNLGFALDSAASAAEPGVYVAFHGRFIPADLVVKEPFNGRTMNYASRDDPVYQEAVRRQQESSARLIDALSEYYQTQPDMSRIADYPVNVVRPNHDELLAQVESGDIRAVLFTLYHSGTANAVRPETSVAELAKQLGSRDIMSFAVTENGEAINFNAYETSVQLREAGIIPLGSMLHDVALAKLGLLDLSLPPAQIREEMLNNRVGEQQPQT
jgi:L-asparaginase/Glu-tRNA(Gln) amidotransferase subunit D